MKSIEVAVINESHECPAGMMMFLAKLTQRGHNIQSMEDLFALYNGSLGKHKTAETVSKLPHGTIKRFTPITIAIVGASRRFLAQARTHQVGITYVSGSLQYSDFSDGNDFVIPYELLGNADEYLAQCKSSMDYYKQMVDSGVNNDTAGYVAPQALRNVLIMQANHESWQTFIRARSCSRNTAETQYVTLRIWEELLKTADGKEMFAWAGPDCMHGSCREGKMSCGKPLHYNNPTEIIEAEFPLLRDLV